MKVAIPFKDLRKHYDSVLIRKYKEMEDSFEGLIKTNPIIYKVYIKDYGDFEEGLTVVNPGKVGKEFFMTKGHKHKKVAPEIYIPVAGKGILLISVNGKETTYELKKGNLYHIPGNSGHRLINTGEKPLEIITIYGKNAGHYYKFKFKRRIKG